MTIEEALIKIKAICFSHLHELQKETKSNPNEETKKALEWEIHELSKAIHLIIKCVTDSTEEHDG